MSMGYFIHVGDKTSCGGTVLGGDQGWIADGGPRARQGDPVSCGEDGETYAITGGIAYILLNGQLAAGTLDSLAGCPCKAILIPSILWAAYSNRSAAARTGTAQPLARAFILGMSGGAVAAVAVALPATKLCLGIGAVTAGYGGIACGLVVVGVVSYGGGKLGETVGTAAGELIYEYSR